jgi:hypothetical protein
MFYVIQRNTWNEPHYDMLIELMERFKLDYEVVDYIPFSGEVTFTTDRKDVFCFGTIRLTELAKGFGWYPGSLLNENHDYSIYAPIYGFENMLNGDGVVIRGTDDCPFVDNFFFARPTADSKNFKGQTFDHENWKSFMKDHKDRNATYLVAPLKQIQQEVRCWVVGGKVVTASLYKIGNRVVYQNYDDESFFVNFAQSMVDKYQPAEAFVIDVCLADDKLKVVEINCINAAGFYRCNLQKLIESLENHFDTTN